MSIIYVKQFINTFPPNIYQTLIILAQNRKSKTAKNNFYLAAQTTALSAEKKKLLLEVYFEIIEYTEPTEIK